MTDDPSSALYDLIEKKEWSDAVRHCKQHPIDAKYKNSWNILPIQWACYRGAPLEVFQCLHEADKKSIMTESKTGRLPVHWACEYGVSFDVVRYLLENFKAGVSAEDDCLRTPMHYACRCCNLNWDVILYLHSLDPSGVKKKDANGKAPIDDLRERIKFDSDKKFVESILNQSLGKLDEMLSSNEKNELFKNDYRNELNKMGISYIDEAATFRDASMSKDIESRKLLSSSTETSKKIPSLEGSVPKSKIEQKDRRTSKDQLLEDNRALEAKVKEYEKELHILKVEHEQQVKELQHSHTEEAIELQNDIQSKEAELENSIHLLEEEKTKHATLEQLIEKREDEAQLARKEKEKLEENCDVELNRLKLRHEQELNALKASHIEEAALKVQHDQEIHMKKKQMEAKMKSWVAKGKAYDKEIDMLKLQHSQHLKYLHISHREEVNIFQRDLQSKELELKKYIKSLDEKNAKIESLEKSFQDEKLVSLNTTRNLSKEMHNTKNAKVRLEVEQVSWKVKEEAYTKEIDSLKAQHAENMKGLNDFFEKHLQQARQDMIWKDFALEEKQVTVSSLSTPLEDIKEQTKNKRKIGTCGAGGKYNIRRRWMF